MCDPQPISNFQFPILDPPVFWRGGIQFPILDHGILAEIQFPILDLLQANALVSNFQFWMSQLSGEGECNYQLWISSQFLISNFGCGQVISQQFPIPNLFTFFYNNVSGDLISRTNLAGWLTYPYPPCGPARNQVIQDFPNRKPEKVGIW